MEEVSKINVFRGRKTRCEVKNQILTGKKGVDVKISAPFLYLNAIGKNPMAFFVPIMGRHSLKTVSKEVGKPLLYPP